MTQYPVSKCDEETRDEIAAWLELEGWPATADPEKWGFPVIPALTIISR
jgi:hypothetical protein